MAKLIEKKEYLLAENRLEKLKDTLKILFTYTNQGYPKTASLETVHFVCTNILLDSLHIPEILNELREISEPYEALREQIYTAVAEERMKHSKPLDGKLPSYLILGQTELTILFGRYKNINAGQLSFDEFSIVESNRFSCCALIYNIVPEGIKAFDLKIYP